ncbi:MAG: M24 family metallopeptidase, partial [Promethearchaeota archaeon]
GLKNRLLADWSSDVTRTFFVGEPGVEAREVYRVVESANRAAVAAVRAGVRARAVDWAARRVVEASGHEIPHSVGHAVGRYSHNVPLLSPLSPDRLVEGQVVTIEPGVYLKGRFGVRIEDLVLVTGDGCEVLSELP